MFSVSTTCCGLDLRLHHAPHLGLLESKLMAVLDWRQKTYLLEAKWTAKPIGVSDLRSFNAKVEDKASWSRGLFISDSGYTEDGLEAFGRGKSIICMDGLDLSDMLERCVPLADVISKKVKRAAETGNLFVRFTRPAIKLTFLKPQVDKVTGRGSYPVPPEFLVRRLSWH